MSPIGTVAGEVGKVSAASKACRGFEQQKTHSGKGRNGSCSSSIVILPDKSEKGHTCSGIKVALPKRLIGRHQSLFRSSSEKGRQRPDLFGEFIPAGAILPRAIRRSLSGSMKPAESLSGKESIICPIVSNELRRCQQENPTNFTMKQSEL